MGLFDFARNIGKKIFGKSDDDDKASEKLQSHIEDDNPGVKGLKVTVKDGVATVKGKAKTASAYEKAVLMAGNALGIEEVRADELDAPKQTVDVTYYEVAKGDSLWKIAKKFYGSGAKYTAIFEENREVIKDPDMIFPGQKIRIPMDE